VPPGTARYWSWLFAAAESRAPLLGIYAAVTGAIKYALTSTFLIPTGDDPEQDRGASPKDAPAALIRPQSPSSGAGAPRSQGPAPARPQATDGSQATGAEVEHVRKLCSEAKWMRGGKVNITEWRGNKLKLQPAAYDVDDLVQMVPDPVKLIKLLEWSIAHPLVAGRK